MHFLHLEQPRNVLLAGVHVEVLHDEDELLRGDGAAAVGVEHLEGPSKLLDLLSGERLRPTEVVVVAVHD